MSSSHFSPLHQIDTFYNGLNQSNQDSLNSAAGGNLLTRNTQEALTIIENKSKVKTSRNKPQVSSVNGSSRNTQNDAIIALTKQIEALGKHISTMHKLIHSIQESCETCGGPHHYSECQAAGDFTQRDVYAATGNYNSGVPPSPLFSSKEVERDLKPTMDQVHISSSESTARVPSLMFKKLHFNISLDEALALMPKYGRMLKDLLSNKKKLLELANTPLNENCLAVLLKKLPEKT
nr:reverse transcriptase domain-containing protein [Tanacetum cinerariifolium]